MFTMFRLETEHIDPTTLLLFQKIQVFHTTLKKWCNGTVTNITDNMCAIEVDEDEIVYVSMSEKFQLFPFQTIPVGRVCPCDGCMVGSRAHTTD